MADWSANVGLTQAYATLLSLLAARDVDAITLSETLTNPPNGAIRWNSALSKFQRWSGAAWVDLVLSSAGGGTGGTTSLGTMAFQSAGNVAITGGTIVGISSLALSGNMIFDGDGTRSIGTAAAQADKIFVKNALVIPVGVDKYAA